jgi:hypothetical protein
MHDTKPVTWRERVLASLDWAEYAATFLAVATVAFITVLLEGLSDSPGSGEPITYADAFLAVLVIATAYDLAKSFFKGFLGAMRVTARGRR